MLEQRVAVLETGVGTIKGILERLEPKISEILLTGAKQADLHRRQLDVAEMKRRMTAMEAKFDGTFAGLQGRISLLPSTWTILGTVFTTWALGSGILIFALTRSLAQ